MSQTVPSSAWIEGAEIGRIPLGTGCTFGRSSSNSVVLNDEKISRRHAAIHLQGYDEYWLVDLGSRNGVMVNGKRITQATRLADQDLVQLGQHRFIFRNPAGARTASVDGATVDRTVSDVKPMDCWLLVLDIESSTHLSQRLTPAELPQVTGKWFDECKRILDREGGSIDKYLGDGFMAFWKDGAEVPAAVARTMAELRKISTDGPLSFRMVLHYGRVFSGGVTASGVERFFGPEVNYIFKSERLASSLQARCIISQAARARLPNRDELKDLGQHEVAGFDGLFTFYTL